LSSTSSGAHYLTWETLSGKFDKALETHETTLNEALRNLQTSELNGLRLSDLLNRSLTQNEGLKTYNQQIAERMQERDEDLASAQDRIGKLEKRCLKAVIAIIALAGVILAYIVCKAIRFFKIIP
jgi:chromosome segregation ATPase